MSRKKVIIFESFRKVWERIQKETEIKTLKGLSELFETTTQNVSNKKRDDYFPVEWGYIVARKYNLLTEWIMEGTGPKRPEEHGLKSPDQEKRKIKNDILIEIEDWLTELAGKDEGYSEWFRIQFMKKFPEFEKWKRKKLEKERKDTLPQQQNIA